jgi:hypothetical protein
MDAAAAKTLDKFYTRPEEARRCLVRLASVCAHLGLPPKDAVWVEPSAGGGAFLQGGDGWPVPLGCDVAPEAPGIMPADFTATPTRRWAKAGNRPLVFVGNPPFGKKGDLARAFLNKALSEGEVVGFILPILFRKWTTQKGVDASASLVADWDIPEDAFTFLGKPYAVRCCFQVWTRRATPGLSDLRQRQAPARAHPDFQMWQYNATPQAARYFDLDWDFGVLRQGYGDHNAHHTSPQTMSRKKQWVLFKASTPAVLARLESIDFNALAATNTSVGGFGKAEIVQHYKERFEGARPRGQNEVFGCG